MRFISFRFSQSVGAFCVPSSLWQHTKLMNLIDSMLQLTQSPLRLPLPRIIIIPGLVSAYLCAFHEWHPLSELLGTRSKSALVSSERDILI